MGWWLGPSPSSCPSSRCGLGQRAPPLCLAVFAVFVGTGGDNRCFSVGVGGGTGLWPRGRAGESPPSASPSPPLPRRARQPPSLLLATTGTEAAVREPGGRCWFPAQFVHFFFTRHSFPHGRRAPAPCRLCPGAGDAMPVRGFPPWGGSWPSGDPRTWLRCGVRGGDASIPGTLGWVFSRVSDLTRICVSWPSGTRRHSRHFFFFFCNP